MKSYEANPITNGYGYKILIRQSIVQLNPKLIEFMNKVSALGNSSTNIDNYSLWEFTEPMYGKAIKFLHQNGYQPISGYFRSN